MINHTRQSIVIPYRAFIEAPEMNYIPESWEEIRYGNTGYVYYRSRHNYGASGKILYHFIFPIFPMTTG